MRIFLKKNDDPLKNLPMGRGVSRIKIYATIGIKGREIFLKVTR